MTARVVPCGVAGNGRWVSEVLPCWSTDILVRRASSPSTVATVPSEWGASAAPATSALSLQAAARTTRSRRNGVRAWCRLLPNSPRKHSARGHTQGHPCGRHTHDRRGNLPTPLLLPQHVTDAATVRRHAAEPGPAYRPRTTPPPPPLP